MAGNRLSTTSSSSSGLSSHVADSFSLYFSKEDMLDTIITGPDMTYEVATPPKAGLFSRDPTTTVTRVDRGEKAETRYIVGEFIWTTIKKTVLRIPDQPGCEDWIPKGDFLRKMTGKRRWGNSRLFTGPSGAQYRWKEYGARGLTTLTLHLDNPGPDAHTPALAVFHPARRNHLEEEIIHAHLDVSPALISMLDIVIVSFLMTERKKWERKQTTDTYRPT
ncbi:hypothetical protein BOTBODRAFT_29822 [Botryobasidium botryosum FD-172 SS1]|uniref:DUF6593 domain-containing protein n=1 Tax=Botryobasidium botryosum (strain FD-172 SS1) TaxID=930990 RepID=A0A067MSH2_BOTB1|nr:hypothetical protein BOTBODRAFT_29822 [Botryobasidium botryosum FD-172 SS1]